MTWIRRPRLTGLLVAAVAVAFAGACADVPPTEPAPDLQEGPLFGAQVARSAATVGLDAHFEQLAREIPGFGGMYRDANGRLNVQLKRSNLALSSTETTALSRRLGALGVAGASDLAVNEAQYDFLTLSSIRSRVNAVLGLSGVVFTDVDEARNRVTIAVEDDAAARSAEHALQMLGVDLGAVHFAQSEPIKPMVNLTDRVRPVAGGLQINWPGIPGFVCTLGFNVRSPGRPAVHGFVTNSHCTNERGVVTGTPYYQHRQDVAETFIASEVWDLPFFSCADLVPTWPPEWRCRWSDAAGALYAPGVPNSHGRIYRTEFPGTTTNGSLTIDEANPQWTIVDEKAFPLLNDVLHKTGRTTGWTMGSVVNTCVNVGVSGSDPQIVMLCQDLVEARVAGGDSGSPVFERIGETGNVRLVGLLWGGGTNIMAFSAMDNLRFENEGPQPWTTFPGQVPPSAP